MPPEDVLQKIGVVQVIPAVVMHPMDAVYAYLLSSGPMLASCTVPSWRLSQLSAARGDLQLSTDAMSPVPVELG